MGKVMLGQFCFLWLVVMVYAIVFFMVYCIV